MLLLYLEHVFNSCQEEIHLFFKSVPNYNICNDRKFLEIPLQKVFLIAVMAGLATEGTQFDTRQYDAKMNEL